MMNEDERREIRRRLQGEERLRRLEEAGYESGKAPWEEIEEGGSGRRELTEEEMRKTGSDRLYPAGGGSYYSETFVRPTGRTSPESYWNEPRREPPIRRERLTEEEMRKTGSDRVDYPAGTGSYYSETFVKPYGRASPESEFNEPFRNREPPAPRRELTEEEMRRTGSDRTDYPAGTGSYYSETFVKPTGRASPESYWNEGRGEPPARRVKAAPEHRKRTERHHPVKKTRVVKHAEAPPRPIAARQEKVHRELVYEPPREKIYEGPVESPIRRTSPFETRAPAPQYETVRYTEVVPERYVERYEIGPDGKERLLSSRKLEAPEQPVPERYAASERGERIYEPSRRGDVGRSAFREEREWVDPRSAGHLRGRAHTAWGSASEKGQQYGTEAAGRGREFGHRISEWGKGASQRAGDWSKEAGDRAREAAEGREFEDSAYRAGSTLGSAIRKVTSVSRELSSGFREGMGEEYPEGNWQEARERARERYHKEESRYHEGSLERRRPPHSHEGWEHSEEEEIEVSPRRTSAEVKERPRAVSGEVKERTPSKKVSSSAKRTASTAKRKVEKAEEDW